MSSNNSAVNTDIHPFLYTTYSYFDDHLPFPKMEIVKRSKLGKLLESRQSKIYVGRVNLNGLEFKLKEGENDRDLGTFNSLKEKILYSSATVSPFGKGSETVVDLNVRNGLEIKADRFDPSFINTLQSDNSFKTTIKKIQDALSIKEIEAKFVKMAIYIREGRFAKHRDTPHAENHLATLLIATPLNHSGGEFVLHNDSGNTFRWNSSYENCIAFFTDVVHEVEPVTSGVRAVLQFDIFSKKNNENLQKKIDIEASNDNEEEEKESCALFGVQESKLIDFQSLINLEEIIKETENYCKSSPIAIPLSHLYRNRSLLPSLLKGIDKELYLALEKAGFRVFLSQVVAHHIYMPEEYSSDTQEFQYEVIASEPPADIPRDLKWNNVKYIISNGSALHVLEKQDYIEYTGNEAQEEIYKYFGGIILVLPPL